MNIQNIAIIGAGYVGLSNAVLLAQHNEVVALDLDAAKVAAISQGRSPIVDADIEHYLAHKPLNLRATLDAHDAYAGADFVIIATLFQFGPCIPTNKAGHEIVDLFDHVGIQVYLPKQRAKQYHGDNSDGPGECVAPRD